MISRFAYHGLTWIDLESPSREEILHIGEEFGLSKLVEEELFTEHAPATLDVYDGYVYLTLLCPTANEAGTSVTNPRLTAIIGQKYLITFRTEKIEGLYSFASEFEHVEKLDQSKKLGDGSTLFAEMMKHIYAHAHKDLSNIAHRIKTLEHALFNTDTERLSKALLNAKLTALAFKEGIAAHGGLLKAYGSVSDDKNRAISLNSEHAALCNAIDMQYEILCVLQKTTMASIASKTANRVRTLTYVAIALLALTLILHFA